MASCKLALHLHQVTPCVHFDNNKFLEECAEVDCHDIFSHPIWNSEVDSALGFHTGTQAASNARLWRETEAA
jgi:hypothetical protein